MKRSISALLTVIGKLFITFIFFLIFPVLILQVPITNADFIEALSSDGACNVVPAKIILTSHTETLEGTTHTFKWDENVCATWYKLYFKNTSTNNKFVQWYEIEDNNSTYPDASCSGGQCSVTLDKILGSGNYEWYMRGYNDIGNGDWSDGLNFTVQADETLPEKVAQSSPTGQIEGSTYTYTWVKDSFATYYKLWVGYSNGDKVFTKWYESVDICSGGNCSVTIETELMDGNYEWYIKSWNDYGKVWSGGMAFSITGNFQTIPDNSSWLLTLEPIPGSLQSNVGECPTEGGELLLRLIRTGNSLTFTSSGLENGTGTINGSQLTLNGSHTEENDDGNTEISYSGVLTFSSSADISGQLHIRASQGSYYCEWDSSTTGGLIHEVKPEFIGSFTHPDITTSFNNTIDVADNGDIYINNHPLSSGLYPSKSTIVKVSPSLNYQGSLQDNGNNIYADNMVMDSNGIINTELFGLFQADYCKYDISSSQYDCSSYFNSGNVYIGNTGDMDSSGNHYIIPFSGSGSNAAGRSLFIWKVSPDFLTRLGTLEKEDFIQMLPDTPEEDQFALNDIRIADDGKIFICVDLDGSQNSDKDGLLILDANMKKLNYLGNDWQFNFPTAVDFDTSGNIYVASTYHNQVLILSDKLQQIGTIKWSDIQGISSENDFLPTDLKVKNNKLYIFNSGKNTGELYIFDL